MHLGNSATPTEPQAALFKSLGHPSRVIILEILARSGPQPVTELLQRTGLEASNLSQHLGVLRRNQLIEASQTEGHRRYRLSSPLVGCLLEAGRAVLKDRIRSIQQDLGLPVGPVPGTYAGSTAE